MASQPDDMQRKGLKIFGIEYSPDYQSKSFYEKLKEHAQLKRESGASTESAQRMMRGLMCFVAPSQIYVFTQYIVPFTIGDYGPWAEYYFKVFCWFLLINGLANWFCVILYDPAVPKTRDRPDLARVADRHDNPPDQFVPMIQEAVSQQNGSVVYDMTEKEGLPWEFCDECQMHIPPRAHHCKFCKKCILKRDHHCFMVGNCIGFKNQRFFIVLAFYAMLVGTLGFYFQLKYLEEMYWPMSDSWTEFIPPVTVIRWLFGDIPGYICLIVVLLYLDFLFGLVGLVYFVQQMTIVIGGKTLFEVVKKFPIRNMNSAAHNLRSVFGDFWGLNFIFPMVVILRQREDGVHWNGVKLYHTGSGKKWEDDGSIL